MKRSIRTSLITVALALLAVFTSLVWLGSRPDTPDEPFAESVSGTSGGPSFQVRVIVPRMARPFAGIVPDWIVKKFDLTPSELRFDHTSPGAQMRSVGLGQLEIRADGWSLFIETDSEGRVAAGTHLVFPLALGGRHVRLDCRTADRANGYLRTITRPDSDELSGSFLVELGSCTNAESGRTSDWPASPLTVRGSFARLPSDRR